MAEYTKYQSRLLKAASVIGILQGTIWVMVASMYLIFFSNGPTLPNRPTERSRLEYLNDAVNLFFSYNSFNPSMWVCLILNTFWIATSLVLSCYIGNKISGASLKAVKWWEMVTCLVSHFNFILVIVCSIIFDRSCDPQNQKVDADTKQVCDETQNTMLFVTVTVFFIHCLNWYIMVAAFRTIRSLKRSWSSEDGESGCVPETGNPVKREQLLEKFKDLLKKMSELSNTSS